MSASFGELVADARKKQGLSQREFAAKIQVSTTYLSDIENGRRNPTGEDLIGKIAKALGMTEQEKDHLCLVAGAVPEDIQKAALKNPRKVTEEFALFRANLRQKRED